MPKLPVIVTIGNGFIFIIVGAEVRTAQPEPSLYETVYDPAVFTLILLVVAPLLHTFPVFWLEISITLSPWQNVVGPPASIDGGVVKASTTFTVSES